MYKIHTAEEVADLNNILVDGVTYSIPGFDSELSSMGYMYQTNIPLQSDATGAYYNIFYSEGIGHRHQVAGAIIYDYENDVKNRLVQYFCPTYPGDGFYLKPSDYAVNDLYDTQDIRSLTQKMVMNSLGGEPAVLTKYYYSYVASSRTYKYLRDDIEKIQPSIVTFRGHDFHFLLAEAENHLGNWQMAQALLNGGITNQFAQRPGTGGRDSQRKPHASGDRALLLSATLTHHISLLTHSLPAIVGTSSSTVHRPSAAHGHLTTAHGLAATAVTVTLVWQAQPTAISIICSPTMPTHRALT